MEQDSPARVPASLRTVLENTRPLQHARGARLPLYVLPISNTLRGLGDDITRKTLMDLASRGIGYTVAWAPNDQVKSRADGLRMGRLAQEAGLPVAVDATACLDGFFDGSEPTLHRDSNDQPFADLSFDPGRKMGCPFGLSGRLSVIRERLDFFLRGYAENGMEIDFIFADWEIDGPLEWNDAWANSKRCRRCRAQIKGLDDFRQFQVQVRAIRSQLQRECFVQPVRRAFPRALVGNYGVYPQGRYRYWYDYYERLPAGAPFLRDQNARYREWVSEFDACEYSLGMPVVYTWYPIYSWYNFKNSDYRWFYNGLLVGSNSGQHASHVTPLVTFVHRATTAPPPQPEPDVQPLSAAAYQELLWHLLLRGHDGFFLWCLPQELADEVRLVHEVYAESLQYAEFFNEGRPVTFEIPKDPTAVVSGLRVGRRVLVLRTDFDERTATVSLRVDNHLLEVRPAQKGVQVMVLP